jgi:deazaflavin-dependent oxidoreductase (nitroreductase family)
VPLPSWLARFNKTATNRVLGGPAGWVPPGAVVVHRGRRTGREYRTPVLAFPVADGLVIALTYGRRVDWLANVLAAGECQVVRRGRAHLLVEPIVLTGPSALTGVPGWVRAALQAFDVTESLRLRYPSARSRMGTSAKSGESSATRLNS